MTSDTDNPFNGRGAAQKFIEEQLGEDAFDDESSDDEFGWQPGC